MGRDAGIENQIQEAHTAWTGVEIVGRVTSEGTRTFEGTAEIVLPNGKSQFLQRENI